MIKCNSCNEMFNRKDIDEHIKKCDQDFSCQHCQQKFKKNDIKRHQDICYNRPQKCAVCKLEFNKDLIDDHFRICSNRTQQCQYCNNNIKLLDYPQHEPICQIEQMNKEQCLNCFQRFNKNQMINNLCKICSVKESKFNQPIRIKRSQKNSDQTKKCYICLKDFSISQYQQHLILCKNMERKPNDQQDFNIKKIRCQQCKQKIVYFDYPKHEKDCLQNKLLDNREKRINSGVKVQNIRKMCMTCQSNDIDPFTNELKHKSFCPIAKQQKKISQQKYQPSYQRLNQKFENFDFGQKNDSKSKKRKQQKEDERMAKLLKQQEEDERLARQLMQEEQQQRVSLPEQNYLQYLGDLDEDEALAKALAESEKYNQVK